MRYIGDKILAYSFKLNKPCNILQNKYNSAGAAAYARKDVTAGCVATG